MFVKDPRLAIFTAVQAVVEKVAQSYKYPPDLEATLEAGEGRLVLAFYQGDRWASVSAHDHRQHDGSFTIHVHPYGRAYEDCHVDQEDTLRPAAEEILRMIYPTGFDHLN